MRPNAHTLASLGLAMACVCGLASGQAPTTEPTPVPSPRDLHSADCVAALDANTHDLAAQVQAGKESARTVLMTRLVAGASFVGEAYLHGGVDESEAKALADQAREAQQRLPAKELAARQAACAAEGTRLFEAANGLQRAVVRRMAKKRMDKLLGG